MQLWFNVIHPEKVLLAFLDPTTLALKHMEAMLLAVKHFGLPKMEPGGCSGNAAFTSGTIHTN